jgi:hypothetical protein
LSAHVSRMMVVSLIPIVLGVAAPQTYVAAAHPRSIAATKDQITFFVTQFYPDGLPISGARELRGVQGATNKLLGLLANPNYVRYRSNLVLTLGVVGDESAVSALIDYLERREGDRPLSRDDYAGKTDVLTGLAYLVNQSSDPQARKEGLEYLKKGVEPGFWLNGRIKWSSNFDRSNRERNLYLTRLSIHALGLSGHPEALEHLKGLQKHLNAVKGQTANSIDAAYESGHSWTHDISQEELERVRGVVAESIDLNSRINSIGLEAYYRP